MERLGQARDELMSRSPSRLCLLLALSLSGSVLLGVDRASAQEIPKQHGSRNWAECRRCRTAYAKALEHTLRRLRRASFPAKMVMGWLLLADGRQAKDLKHVIDEAMRWRQMVGTKKAHNHRRNWYPALAGILLAEYGKYQPSRKLRQALTAIVEHFVFVQERTGGWYKWHEGAYKDRLDYPVKDLGILNAMIFGFLCTVRAQGVQVPTEAFKRADACLHNLLSRRGISYGTGSRGGDITGARGAFALNGLLYAREKKHEIARIYEDLLPRQIPNMDKGHHVGAFHCLGVTLGCHLLGPKAYRQLTDHWLDRLIDRQQADGGIYVGDDEDSGGEKKLLGEDDASTAVVALLILLQDPTRLVPSKRPQINWLAVDLAPSSTRKFSLAVKWASQGKLSQVLALVERSLTQKQGPPEDESREAATIKKTIEEHARTRLDEALSQLESAEVLRALEILEPLAKALAGHEVGAAAQKHLNRISKDPGLQSELKAQKELLKAWQSAYRRGLRKARPAFERVIERFPETLAAKKAREVIG